MHGLLDSCFRSILLYIALGKQLLIAHTPSKYLLIVHTRTCITMWTPQYCYASQLHSALDYPC